MPEELIDIKLFNQYIDDMTIEDVGLTTSIAFEKCDPLGYERAYNEWKEKDGHLSELEDEDE